MSIPRDLRAKALELSGPEREELAHALLRSLEPEGSERSPGYEKAWASEIERRLRDIDEGRAKLLTWQEVSSTVTDFS